MVDDAVAAGGGGVPTTESGEAEVAALLAAAAAQPPAVKFRLVVQLGASTVKDVWFEKEAVTIGRDPACDLHLDNQSVSRRHAAIVRRDGVYAFVDKKTENRSHVNGKLAGDFTLLNSGDEILVGKFTVKFENPTAGTFAAPDVFDAKGADMDKLGGSTLAISRQATTKLVKERGRKKGFIVLPTKPGANSKVFVAEAFVIGSSSDCDLRIKGFFAPRRAAIVTRGMDDYRVYNVAPKPDHVTVNGKPVSNFVVLSSNDVIRVGKHEVTFTVAD